MWPVWFAVVFVSIFAAYSAMDIPQRKSQAIQIAADVSATNLIAYRSAVQKYLSANPAATGIIDDSALAPYWKLGYIRNATWTNLIAGSALYVYSNGVVTANTLDSLHQKSRENVLFGTKNAINGRLISYNGFDTGVDLPGSIPNNAIVMIGR